jgi:hypothetical protein
MLVVEDEGENKITVMIRWLLGCCDCGSGGLRSGGEMGVAIGKVGCREGEGRSAVGGNNTDGERISGEE